jgi:lipopolysaccharide/colanic/teichoic acid biosynthesis glycosyltransferase
VLTAGVRFTERNHVPLLSVNSARLSRMEAVRKRAFDCAVGSVLFVLFTPVMAVMAAWQRVHGARSLLVRITAGTRDGAPFTLVRFASPAPFHSDFFEKLPGLLSVVTGRMSLVGPRPASNPVGTTMCGGLKPGLTGAWRESDDPAAQAIADLCYIRAYSIGLDVQVLMRRLRNRMRHPHRAAPILLAAERPAQS